MPDSLSASIPTTLIILWTRVILKYIGRRINYLRNVKKGIIFLRLILINKIISGQNTLLAAIFLFWNLEELRSIRSQVSRSFGPSRYSWDNYKIYGWVYVQYSTLVTLLLFYVIIISSKERWTKWGRIIFNCRVFSKKKNNLDPVCEKKCKIIWNIDMKYFMELGCYFDEQLAYEIEKSILNFCAVLSHIYWLYSFYFFCNVGDCFIVSEVDSRRAYELDNFFI